MYLAMLFCKQLIQISTIVSWPGSVTIFHFPVSLQLLDLYVN